jgi:hypothetical protein
LFNTARAERSSLVAGAAIHVASRRRSEVAARIRDTLQPSELDAVLYGSVAAADRDESCWAVNVAIGFDTLIVALRAIDGELLVAWQPPEG